MDSIYYLQGFASPLLDSFFLTITNLGSERAYIVMLMAAYLALDARLGRLLGIALLTSFYLNFILKGVFNTPRPYLIDPEVLRGDEAYATGTGPGFPSGHAQAAATFWLLAASYLGRAWFWIVAILLTFLIGLSRIYLGLHIPADVFGGLIIGLLIVLLALWMSRALSENALPRALIITLGIAIPLLLHLMVPPLNPDFVFAESDLLMGGLAAFITAPVILHYQASESLWRRTVLALLGIVLVFAFLIGSSLLIPETLKRIPIIGFIRYLTLGYVGLLLTPWLGQRSGLAPRKA